MKKKPSTDEAPAKVESKINPALEPLTRLTSTLKLDERNARKHERRSVDTIKASLSTYGQQKPIVALTDGTVIAGNGTLEAARELGWERIAVVTFDTEDEARARVRDHGQSQRGAVVVGLRLAVLVAANCWRLRHRLLV